LVFPVTPPPPFITNVTAVARPTSAIINWTTVSNATSQVEYGFTTNCQQLSPLRTALTTDHAVLLLGLVPNTNYFFRALSRVGTNEMRSAIYSFSTDLTVIVDNPSVIYGGPWIIGASSPDKFGTYYQYAPTVEGEPTATADYVPTLPMSAKYDVSLWYPQGDNRTTNAPVLIFSAEGSAVAAANQTTGGGAWRLVAPAKLFADGSSGFARIQNNSGEPNRIIIADAVRWSYALSQDYPRDGTVPAWWANLYFGRNVNASVDHDGDGCTTYAEYVAGTVPTDPASRFGFRLEPAASNSWRAIFSPCYGDRTYELQTTTNLNAAPWLTLAGLPVTSTTNCEGTITVPNASSGGSGYFRLTIRLAQ
jgi:hypothetical protein